MPGTAFLDLDNGKARRLAVQRAPIVLDGFSIQHVRLETAASYEFESAGAMHYVALHDLALEDGELMSTAWPRSAAMTCATR